MFSDGTSRHEKWLDAKRLTHFVEFIKNFGAGLGLFAATQYAETRQPNQQQGSAVTGIFFAPWELFWAIGMTVESGTNC